MCVGGGGGEGGGRGGGIGGGEGIGWLREHTVTTLLSSLEIHELEIDAFSLALVEKIELWCN